MADADRDDTRLRQAAFRHLTSLLSPDGAVTRDMMAVPFFVDDERCTLVDPRRGIHKPRAMRHLLSITTVMAGSGRRIWYADQETVHSAIYSGDDSILYSFMGTDPTAPQNRALKESLPKCSRPRSGCRDATLTENPLSRRCSTTRRPRKPVSPKTVTVPAMRSLQDVSKCRGRVRQNRPPERTDSLQCTER